MIENVVAALIEEEMTIEKALEDCEKSLEGIGALAIRIQSFSRSAGNLSKEESEAERLVKKAGMFSKMILKLGNKRSKLKNKEKEEMLKSRIDVQKEYMENSVVDQPITDEDFFSLSTKRINNVLMDAMDVFETVKRQNTYINKANERIRSGLSRIGLSKDLIDHIDRRYLSDRTLFIGVVISIVVLLILVKFLL